MNRASGEGQHRLPGNRIVRRRLRAQQVIDVPPPPPPVSAPDAGFHAKQFFLAYTALVVVGTILLQLPWATADGERTPLLDAFFTAVSASSVTGLVVVDTRDHWSFMGELVILLLIQAGGLGFMVGASIVLTVLRQGESLRGAMLLQDGTPTMSIDEALRLSRRILRFLLVVESVGAVCLSIYFLQFEPVPRAIWHGIFTSVSAFCNAGFDLQGSFQSMADHRNSWWLNIVLMLLIQSGALSFIVFSDIWENRSWRRLALDVKLVLVMNAALLVVGTVVFLVAEWQGNLGTSAEQRVQAALFQSTSLRTAGFATINFGDLHMASIFASVGIMAVGGASGSTAGGMKLATVGVIGLAIYSVVRGDDNVHAFGRRIGEQVVFRALSVVVLFVSMHFVLTIILSITEQAAGHSFGFAALMFETMSGMATVGLTTGITPLVSDLGKVVLCVAMFFGRLGPLTVAYALQGRQRRRLYRLPEAQIRIG